MLSVGKPRDPALAGLHNGYASRLERLGLRYRSDWVSDVKPGGRFSEAHALERESGLLLDRLGDRGTVVACDIRGKLLTSPDLAAKLEPWCTPQLTLVVGGPSGLHRIVLDRADFRWSLSALTFPHELVRVLLVEQLYRAACILRRTPYHK